MHEEIRHNGPGLVALLVASVTLLATIGLTSGWGLNSSARAQQSPTYVAEGDIQGSNPATKGTSGVTESEFAETCTYPPGSQGADGWVFELPDGFTLPAPASVTGTSAVPYDLDAWFYTSDCQWLDAEGDDNMATDNPDETGTISANTKYVVVNAPLGADTHVVLCAGDQTGCAVATSSASGSASSSPSGSPSASPSGSPTAEPDPVRHPRKISLRLVHRGDGLRAAGRVRVPDGHTRCRQNVPVNLQKRSGGKWATIRSTNTRTNGRYRIQVADRAGRYRAVAVRQRLSGRPDHVCGRAARGARHRH